MIIKIMASATKIIIEDLALLLPNLYIFTPIRINLFYYYKIDIYLEVKHFFICVFWIIFF